MFHSSYAAALIWTAVVYQLMMLPNAQNNAPSQLPTTMNQTNKTYMASSVPDATGGPEMTYTPTSQTRTIIGIAVAVIASLLVLIVIVIFRKRQNRRRESIDGDNGSVNKIQADVTPMSTYDIPSRPGTVNPKPHEYDVIAESTYETPSPAGAVNLNPNESAVMSAYEIPRPPTIQNHQFTQEQKGIVHEYANIKLSSQE